MTATCVLVHGTHGITRVPKNHKAAVFRGHTAKPCADNSMRSLQDYWHSLHVSRLRLTQNRYSFMRRNVRRLHREANTGAAIFAPRLGSTEEAQYTADGRTKRRKAASLAELTRFYEAAVAAASEVFSTTPAVGKALLCTPILPEPPRSTTAALTTSLAVALSPTRGGVPVLADKITNGAGADGGSCSNVNGEHESGGRDRRMAHHRRAAITLSDSGKAFRETLRKKLEATGGTRCKLGSTKKTRAAGAVNDDNFFSGGGGPAMVVFGGCGSGGAVISSGGGSGGSAVKDDRGLRFSSAAGYAERAAGGVQSTIASSSRTCSRYHEQAQESEQTKIDRSRHKAISTPRTSFPKAVYPKLPGFKSDFLATPSQPKQPYSRSSLSWRLPPNLPVEATDCPQICGSPMVVAPERTLVGTKSCPPPPPGATTRPTIDIAPCSEFGIQNSAMKKTASARQEGATAPPSKSVQSCAAPEQRGTMRTLGKGTKKRHLCDGPAPLMPYCRRRKETTRGDGRQVTFALPKKDSAAVTPPATEAAPPVVRFGIMQQRQVHRSASGAPMSTARKG